MVEEPDAVKAQLLGSARRAHSWATGQVSNQPICPSSPFQPWASITPQWMGPPGVRVSMALTSLDLSPGWR